MRMLPSLPTLTPCLVPALKSAAEVRCVIWGLAEAALAGVVGASTTSPTARAQPAARPRLRRVRIETSEPGTSEVDMGSSLSDWRSEEQTSELQSRMRISDAVLCLTKKIDKST